MKLLATQGWAGTEELISDSPTEKEISRLIQILDWQQFNSVRLEKDVDNWVDVSGSINEHGFAVAFEEDGIRHVSKETPKGLRQLEEVLMLFLHSGNLIQFLPSNAGVDESTDHADYSNWKLEFDAKQKIARRKLAFRFIAIFIFTFLLGLIFYLWSKDELKFIGRDTAFVTATVTQAKWEAIKGGYVQKITYEFEFNGTRSSGAFIATKLTGSHQVGDLIRVKFATDDPSISRRVGKLKRRP